MAVNLDVDDGGGIYAYDNNEANVALMEGFTHWDAR